MSGSVEHNIGTIAVRDDLRFNEFGLAHWMARNVSDYEGPLTVEQFRGGQSNPTYLLSTPSARYVLRRKPPGILLKGAHAVDREARVIAALSKAGFPVPGIYGLCMDDAVIGSWFYVMELVEGRIFWDASLESVPRSERAAIYDAMNATIASLHEIDFQAVGLEDYGRPGGYVARQIARWSAQYLEDQETGRDPAMDALLAWLPDHVPASDAVAITHGDFRIDNLVFHANEPRVAAVLDWELSTLGNPDADFAYHAMMYRTPPDIVAGLRGADAAALGIPSEADYLEAYCQRTGRAVMPDYDYYLAFNFFRLAAIFHGIAGRVRRGTAASANARDRAKAFPLIAALGREAMEACR